MSASYKNVYSRKEYDMSDEYDAMEEAELRAEAELHREGQQMLEDINRELNRMSREELMLIRRSMMKDSGKVYDRKKYKLEK